MKMMPAALTLALLLVGCTVDVRTESERDADFAAARRADVEGHGYDNVQQCQKHLGVYPVNGNSPVWRAYMKSHGLWDNYLPASVDDGVRVTFMDDKDLKTCLATPTPARR